MNNIIILFSTKTYAKVITIEPAKFEPQNKTAIPWTIILWSLILIVSSKIPMYIEN